MARKAEKQNNSTNNSTIDDSIIWPDQKYANPKPVEKLRSRRESAIGENYTNTHEGRMKTISGDEEGLTKTFYLSGENPDAFGKDLEALRLSLGLRPVDMARRMACDNGNYRRLEKGGASFPRQDTLRHLAQALGGSIVVTYPANDPQNV